MKSLNEYISEKLVVNKDIKDSTCKELMKYLEDKYELSQKHPYEWSYVDEEQFYDSYYKNLEDDLSEVLNKNEIEKIKNICENFDRFLIAADTSDYTLYDSMKLYNDLRHYIKDNNLNMTEISDELIYTEDKNNIIVLCGKENISSHSNDAWAIVIGFDIAKIK